ncbi:MAG: hypothetical protein RIF32_06640, partial [Leptospirales bacterium]
MKREQFYTILVPAAMLLLAAALPACQSIGSAPERNDANTMRGDRDAKGREAAAELETPVKSEGTGSENAASKILPGRTGCVEGNCVNGEGVYVY